MEIILKDINAVVGVTGSFVCDGEGQVLAKALPGVFDEAMLSPVGRTMAQTIAGLRIARRLIVKSVEEGCLCILCVRRINVPLLNLTANVAVRKLEEKIRSTKSTTIAEPVAKPEPAPEPEPEPASKMTRAELMAKSLNRRR
jgi:hypothetical protein